MLDHPVWLCAGECHRYNLSLIATLSARFHCSGFHYLVRLYSALRCAILLHLYHTLNGYINGLYFFVDEALTCYLLPPSPPPSDDYNAVSVSVSVCVCLLGGGHDHDYWHCLTVSPAPRGGHLANI